MVEPPVPTTQRLSAPELWITRRCSRLRRGAGLPPLTHRRSGIIARVWRRDPRAPAPLRSGASGPPARAEIALESGDKPAGAAPAGRRPATRARGRASCDPSHAPPNGQPRPGNGGRYGAAPSSARPDGRLPGIGTPAPRSGPYAPGSFMRHSSRSRAVRAFPSALSSRERKKAAPAATCPWSSARPSSRPSFSELLVSSDRGAGYARAREHDRRLPEPDPDVARGGRVARAPLASQGDRRRPGGVPAGRGLELGRATAAGEVELVAVGPDGLLRLGAVGAGREGRDRRGLGRRTTRWAGCSSGWSGRGATCSAGTRTGGAPAERPADAAAAALRRRGDARSGLEGLRGARTRRDRRVRRHRGQFRQPLLSALSRGRIGGVYRLVLAW